MLSLDPARAVSVSVMAELIHSEFMNLNFLFFL